MNCTATYPPRKQKNLHNILLRKIKMLHVYDECFIIFRSTKYYLARCHMQ